MLYIFNIDHRNSLQRFKGTSNCYKRFVLLLHLYFGQSCDIDCIVEQWETNFSHDGSLQAMIKDKLGGDLEEACLFLINDPIDTLCLKLKRVMFFR